MQHASKPSVRTVFVALAAVHAALGAAMVACNDGSELPFYPPDGEVEQPRAEAGPPQLDVDADTTTTDARAPSQPGTSCTTDADCGSDADSGAALGACNLPFGLCVCNEGFYVQLSGTCGATEPPACEGQGGTCAESGVCESTASTHGDAFTNATCGDAAAATCCYETTCPSPYLVSCEAPSDAMGERPVCVNGWLTCAPGQTLTQYAD